MKAMSKTTTRKKKKLSAADLREQLLAFYWQILQDADLKPSDRIASAKRLEALFADEKTENGPTVYVTLNLPDAGYAKKNKKCLK